MGFAFCKIQFYNLFLLIGMFRPFRCNMIISIVGFNSFILLFFFSICSMFFPPIFLFFLTALGWSHFYDYILFSLLVYSLSRFFVVALRFRACILNLSQFTNKWYCATSHSARESHNSILSCTPSWP